MAKVARWLPPMASDLLLLLVVVMEWVVGEVGRGQGRQ